MEQNQELIKKLVSDHEARPKWKEPRTLLSLWCCLHVIYFIVLLSIYPGFSVAASFKFFLGSWFMVFMSWYMFNLLLTKNIPESAQKYLAFCVLGALIFMGEEKQIVNLRGLGFFKSDLTCFLHGTAAALLPILVFPFVIKQFFVPRIFLPMVFVTIHLTIMAISLVELTCDSHEFWHLMLGHQGIYLGIFGLLFGFYQLRKRF